MLPPCGLVELAPRGAEFFVDGAPKGPGAARLRQAAAAMAFEWVKGQPNQHVRQEAVTAIAGAFLNIPEPIRDIILEPADPELQSEIKQGIADIMQQSQDVEPEESPNIER